MPWIVEWLWVPLYGAGLWFLRVVIRDGNRITALEQAEKDRRLAEEERRERDKQLLKSIKEHNGNLTNHNETVLTAINAAMEQGKANGRRIGQIEKLIMEKGLGKE